jgi:hypothetical protein
MIGPLEVPTTKIGTYIIVGEIVFISEMKTSRITQSLYWNKTYNQYFLKKVFVSNKVHIDFFDSSSFIYDDLYFHKSGYGITYIGGVENNDITKELYFDFDSDSYFVNTITEEKSFTVVFKNMIKKRIMA